MSTIVATPETGTLPDLGDGITFLANGSVLIHQQETIDGAVCYRKGDVWDIEGNQFTQTTSVGLTGVQNGQLVFMDLSQLRAYVGRGNAKFVGRTIGHLPNNNGDRYISGGILAYAMGSSRLTFNQLEVATGYSEQLLRAIQFNTIELDDHIATEIIKDILENINAGLLGNPINPDSSPMVKLIPEAQRLEELETRFPCNREFCGGNCEWEYDIDQAQRVHTMSLARAEGRVMEYLIDEHPQLVHEVSVELTDSEVVGSAEIWEAIRDLNLINSAMGSLEIAEVPND